MVHQDLWLRPAARLAVEWVAAAVHQSCWEDLCWGSVPEEKMLSGDQSRDARPSLLVL